MADVKGNDKNCAPQDAKEEGVRGKVHRAPDEAAIHRWLRNASRVLEAGNTPGREHAWLSQVDLVVWLVTPGTEPSGPNKGRVAAVWELAITRDALLTWWSAGAPAAPGSWPPFLWARTHQLLRSDRALEVPACVSAARFATHPIWGIIVRNADCGLDDNQEPTVALTAAAETLGLPKAADLKRHLDQIAGFPGTSKRRKANRGRGAAAEQDAVPLKWIASLYPQYSA